LQCGFSRLSNLVHGGNEPLGEETLYALGTLAVWPDQRAWCVARVARCRRQAP
jgi:hypothetical protein